MRISIPSTIKKDIFDKKIYLYFSYNFAGEGFDPREGNYEHKNLNPLTVPCRVNFLTAEKAYFRQYGKDKLGMIEVLCEDRYKTWFEKCNKIIFDSVEYQVFKEGVGDHSSILKRSGSMIRVVLERA